MDSKRIRHQNIYSALDLIENFEQNLNYLSITDKFGHSSDNTELSSIVLLNLGQILPSKLEYLSLSLKINASDFEVFLKNSQNTFIKKLIIRNNLFGKCQNVLPYIKEYIMKEKRVKYWRQDSTTALSRQTVEGFSVNKTEEKRYKRLEIFYE